MVPAIKKTTSQLLIEREELYREIEKSDGELSGSLELALFTNVSALANKAEAVQYAIGRLESEAAFLKDQAEMYVTAAKVRMASVKRIKDRMKSLLVAMDGKITGETVEFYVAKSQPALQIDACPSEYTMQVTETVPDKERIKADLKAGKEIAGCSLVESYSLRTRIVTNKG
jgi:hypothetical protein